MANSCDFAADVAQPEDAEHLAAQLVAGCRLPAAVPHNARFLNEMPRAAGSVCATAWAERRTSLEGKPEADMVGMRHISTSVCSQWSRRA
jgi:hypothetical protein